MSINFGALIDETKGLLLSWPASEQSTTLTATIGAFDVAFAVTANRGIATGMSPGIVEIDQEVLFADSLASDGTATVPAWGRGYLNTVPAAHLAGSRVVSQPQFPRKKIADAINQTLERIFPKLFAVKSYETVTTPIIRTYLLPADAQRMLSVRWQLPDGSQAWQSVRRWRTNPGGGTKFGDTGITVDIADAMLPGRPLQFLYAAKPGRLTAETDDFETVTGLSLSIEDVVTTGAAVAMLPAQEFSRLQTSSVEQQNRAQLVAPAAALTSTRVLEQRFQTRIAEEAETLRLLYPPHVTRSWM